MARTTNKQTNSRYLDRFRLRLLHTLVGTRMFSCYWKSPPDQAATLLSPHQLIVGMPSVLEFIIQAVHNVVEEASKMLMLFQGDLVNPFSNCNRDSTFKAVEEIFP